MKTKPPELLMPALARHPIELVIRVSKETSSGRSSPLGPNPLLKFFSEVSSELAREECEGYQYERRCPAQGQVEAFRQDRRKNEDDRSKGQIHRKDSCTHAIRVNFDIHPSKPLNVRL